MVDSREPREQAGRCRISDQTHRLPRNGESALDLGADRHPLYELSERVAQIMVQLVSAVVPDVLTQQAGADPERDPVIPASAGSFLFFCLVISGNLPHMLLKVLLSCLYHWGWNKSTIEPVA